ncbi:MAG: 50S ribosomal protein L28 [Candidatus Komeilibacteria bacterium]|nr:50S ribosomal protein L28 [Candidatus Komeilibacteria bacterium]
MSRVCQITGAGATIGYNISHSKRATKRKVLPNLQSKRLVNPASGKTVRVKLSASALKTLAKWQKAGHVYDLKKLLQN